MTIFLLVCVGIYFIIKMCIDTAEAREKYKKHREWLGKGTYVKLEYELYCDERDKYFEEHADEVDISRATIFDKVCTNHKLEECLKRAQAKLKSMGYRSAIPSYCMPAYRQKEDTLVIQTLRKTFENVGAYYNNKELESYGIKLEEDRDPEKIEDMKIDFDHRYCINRVEKYQKYVKHPENLSPCKWA